MTLVTLLSAIFSVVDKLFDYLNRKALINAGKSQALQEARDNMRERLKKAQTARDAARSTFDKRMSDENDSDRPE